jgi:hypothetical protein
VDVVVPVACWRGGANVSGVPGGKRFFVMAVTSRKRRRPLISGSSKGDDALENQTGDEKIITKFKKVLPVALATVALITASLAATSQRLSRRLFPLRRNVVSPLNRVRHRVPL